MPTLPTEAYQEFAYSDRQGTQQSDFIPAGRGVLANVRASTRSRARFTFAPVAAPAQTTHDPPTAKQHTGGAHHEDKHPREPMHLRSSGGRGRVDGPLIAARARRRAAL